MCNGEIARKNDARRAKSRENPRDVKKIYESIKLKVEYAMLILRKTIAALGTTSIL